ncbi:hypothetical protein K443DRAFT_313626 [Laccaria amethystina LaAM-08-1]|uniref:Uncharacterized protein n=1 Tax=Laccaria amethystina LaAM-08-1 TaxID=1095629 RepID=A0A0C9X3R2_9AGAR|nr:hypothetical protein K443DRAFT_313626 [Laccaria amethystina LaAM-08-1]
MTFLHSYSPTYKNHLTPPSHQLPYFPLSTMYFKPCPTVRRIRIGSIIQNIENAKCRTAVWNFWVFFPLKALVHIYVDFSGLERNPASKAKCTEPYQIKRHSGLFGYRTSVLLAERGPIF